jgi:hypothetical protein
MQGTGPRRELRPTRGFVAGLANAQIDRLIHQIFQVLRNCPVTTRAWRSFRD